MQATKVSNHLEDQLLTDGDRPLGEVAFFTGFSGQSAFTRAFKRWTGETPRGYRQRAR